MSNKTRCKIKRIVAGVLVLLLIAQSIPKNTFAEQTNDNPQQSEKVEETVTITGNAVADATITVTDANSTVVSTTTADGDGKYTVSGLIKGEVYHISVQCVGYHTVDNVLVSFNNVDAEGNYINDIVMQEASIESMYFAFNERVIYYTENANNQFEFRVIDPTGTRTITYSSDDEGIAMVDSASGQITPIGVGTVHITAMDENSETATYTLTINASPQEALTWEYSVPENLTWKDSFTNTVTGGTGNGTVSYQITEEENLSDNDDDIADVDANTGALTFKKPGTVTVTATKAAGTNGAGVEVYEPASAEYTLTVHKVLVDDFSFMENNPAAITYETKDFSNIASSATIESDNKADATGAITYEIVGHWTLDGVETTNVAYIDSNTGKITPDKSGIITVKATRAADDYYELVESTYKLTIGRAIQDEFAFKLGNNCQMTFGDEFINEAQNADNSPVIYAISGEFTLDGQWATDVATVDENTGSVTASKAGIVTVTATSPSDDRYSDKTIEYTLIINKAAQTVVFGNGHENIPAINYGQQTTYANTATANTKLTYTSSDSTVATVDSNSGLVTIIKPGTVTITATAVEDDCYEEASQSYTLTVNKIYQEINFANGEEPSVKFNDNNNIYINKATNADGIEADKYEIILGSEFVSGSINEITGEFIIGGVGGVIQVQATYYENEYYYQTTKTYALHVDKAGQTISFPQNTYEIIAGGRFENVEAEVSELNSGNAIKYTLKTGSDVNGIVESVDVTNGKISFVQPPKAGSATIVATIPGNENYIQATAEYTITVRAWGTDNSMVTVKDADNHDRNWYSNNVSIYANNGYLISETGTENSWEAQLMDVVTDDTDGEDVTIYVKKVDENWIGSLTVNIQKDSVVPAAVIAIEGDNIWDKILTILTFGLWDKESVNMTISSSDALSGVSSVEYIIIEGSTELKTVEELDEITASQWRKYTGEAVAIDKNALYVVYAKVTDNAGNYVYATTNGIVSDKAAPSVDMEILTDSVDGFYTGDVKIKVSAEDAAPYSGISKIEYKVECNEKVTQTGVLYDFADEWHIETNDEGPEYKDLISKWDSDTEQQYIIVDSAGNNEDDVIITVTVTDNAGHTKTDTEVIDIYVADPNTDVIDIRFVDEASVITTVDGVNVYNTERKAEMTITGRKSSFTTPEVVITAVDGDGNVVNNSYEMTEWEISGSSKGNNATMKATVTFNSSAIYELDVKYTDRSEQQTEHYKSETFIIDTEEPTASVTIDTNSWNTLLEVLTFGIYNDEAMTVSASAKDGVTNVAKIEYILSENTSAMTRDILDNTTGWEEYTELFTVDENKVFTVYLKVTDVAGNYSYISSDGHIIDREPSSNIVIDPEDGNEEYGFHKENVDVDIIVQEPTHLSGISSVEYWIEVDGVVKESGELFNFNDHMKGAIPLYKDLVFLYSETIVIDKNKCNADEIYVYVKTVDNAGTGYEVRSEKISINSTVPTIDISYDNNTANMVNGVGYFNSDRVAEIVITDRNSTFNPDGVEIDITAVNGEGEEITLDIDAMKGEWVSVNDKHTLKLTFSQDGEYTYNVSYTNKADMEAANPNMEDSVSPFHFVIDKTASTASLTEGSNTWNRLLEALTFGLYSSDKITLSASIKDEFTDECTVQYIIDDSAVQLTKAQLDGIEAGKWLTYAGDITVDEDMKFAVYLKVTDNAGNVIYVSSDGYIVDKTAPVVQLTPDNADTMHNGVGVYTDDVNIAIKVTDPEPYAGIDTVEYWITADGVETQREVLFDYTAESANQADRQHEFTDIIVVDSDKNNSCDVRVYVAVKDMLGNVYTTTSDEAVRLDIDVTNPVVNITYNNEPNQTLAGVGYYDVTRTATVVVTERTAHFDFNDIKEAFVVTGKNINGESVIEDYKTMFTNPTTVEGETVNDAKHTFKIVFSKDANYTLSVDYRDVVGNVSTVVDSTATTPYQFTVDTTKPVGSISVGKLGTWDKLLTTLTFGLWSKDKIDVTASSSDVTSAVSVYYIKTDSNKTMTTAELDKLTAWKPFSKLTVNSDEQFVIYLKLVDRAGNTTYISSNGVVMDTTVPNVESIQPAITVTPQQPINGIYNDDVAVSVTVKDTINNGTYSGIKEIRYKVLNLGTVTQEGVLFTAGAERTQAWNKANAIIVDKVLNNSNDVVVKVYAVDNVGNEASKSASIKIDTTAPTIDVTYNNNTGETAFAESTYFKGNRVATITITERNFNPSDVILTVTNTDGVQPVLSGWTERKSNVGNGDATTYTATLTYSADGDYTFDIAYADQADNKCTDVDYGTSLAPTKFTIDKTAPVIQVTYDNNEAQNGNYFAADRVATITVTEHNFEQSRIILALTATDDGVASTLPAVGEWRSNGDVHTLTITYANDSLYTFDFDYIDKAGNALTDIAQQSFYIDKTMPSLSISGITDESANNADGNIGFVITASDVNFDVFEPIITAFVKNESGEVKSVNYKLSDVGTESNVNNGKRFTVTNLEADGIYRITCTLTDKAGNEYTEVLLEKEDGSTYTEQKAGLDTLLSFSVNRYGSTYALDDNTTTLVENYYVQNVDNDLIITEVNADPLNDYKVTLNGEELVKDTDYTVIEEYQDGKWYSYKYHINKSFFENDGEYTVVVSSKDKATNDSFSDVKDTRITFVVDRTAPVVSVTGLSEDGNYQTDSQKVTLVPTDDGGALKSIVVSLVDADGKEIKKLLELADEALEKALEEGDGKLTFEIGEGLDQNVKIVCADCSVDADGNTNVFTQTVTGVSVSTSQLMIWWSNEPLRYGVICGAIIIIIGVIVLMLRRKKKK